MEKSMEEQKLKYSICEEKLNKLIEKVIKFCELSAMFENIKTPSDNQKRKKYNSWNDNRFQQKEFPPFYVWSNLPL